MQEKYPKLFHIGTQKAGSTFLYNLLNAHNDTSMHELTEVHYFSSKYNYGLD